MILANGLPTVQYVAGALNVSSGYLSGLLKALTGRSTQTHIQDKVIEKAKENLKELQVIDFYPEELPIEYSGYEVVGLRNNG